MPHAAYTPPPPECHWIEGGVMATLNSAADLSSLGQWATMATGLWYDDANGSGWEISWVEGDRAVLSGYDVEHSEPLKEDELLTGAPDWAAYCFQEQRMDPVGFCFWWEDGSWRCAGSAVETNGTHIAGRPMDSGKRLADRLAEFLTRDDQDSLNEVQRRLDELLMAAGEGRLDEGELGSALEMLADRSQHDVGAGLATATLLGFTPGSQRREIPVL
ncbi:hypothetical protein E0L36_00390 [Streptomyces sp. AJS327]|uniref:hypothetical protein n=1 Tax=Streptomyces sp. AJS327 TaxID=2545265 RepID=UPI0015DF36B4|nr:hypothetical protein [Streptomyces sp. AJS327]MBA0049425.1 hypothetical protein [Streptomyces sp. AJS327]